MRRYAGIAAFSARKSLWSGVSITIGVRIDITPIAAIGTENGSREGRFADQGVRLS